MKARKTAITSCRYDAVIFDMDGVVTRTARVHAEAWKEIFDDFLLKRAERDGEPFKPFSLEEDYPRWVDGKDRADGIRDFLAARGMEIPEGQPDDGFDRETVHGLGNRKNRRFRQLLVERGVERYESTVSFIRELRKSGMAVAVISASKNCRYVLHTAGIEDLFHVVVDGNEVQRSQIPGKPAPDIFLFAAGKLGVSPGRTVVIEDSLAGVESGRRGGFGLVIGVDRTGQSAALARFADVVINDLQEVVMENNSAGTMTADLPLALEHVKEIGDRIGNRDVVVFLDYDGTLTEIVERPELAKLSSEMRQALRDLAKDCTLAIVSGRDLEDICNLVAVDGIIYAGSHGFDISGPGGHVDFQQGTDYLPALDRAEQALHRLLDKVDGCQIERKRFAIAVHFRRVADGRLPEVESAVDVALEANPGLRKTGGKKIFELRPDIDWDKGKAVTWIRRQLDLDGENVLPFYLGDDLTDEDAFRELRGEGIGVLVRDENRPTAAHYALEHTEQVRIFLHMLGQIVRKESP